MFILITEFGKKLAGYMSSSSILKPFRGTVDQETWEKESSEEGEEEVELYSERGDEVVDLSSENGDEVVDL